MVERSVSDKISEETDLMRDRRNVLDKQWWNSMFSSASQVLTFMAGILTAGGMGIVGSALVKTSSFAAVPGLGIGFLAAAATTTILAVVTNMIANRFYFSATYDQFEVNAQHTAKYLVQSLQEEKSMPAQIIEHEQNQRADGKTWVQAVRPNAPQTGIQQQS